MLKNVPKSLLNLTKPLFGGLLKGGVLYIEYLFIYLYVVTLY